MRRLLLMFSAFSTGACVDQYNNVSFYISGNIAPDVAMCSYGLSGTLLFEGVIDISFNRFEYLLHPLYNNRIMTRSSTGPLRTNTNDIQVQGAVISIYDKDRTNPLFPAYSAPASTTVPSGTLDAPGQQVGSITIVPREFFTDAVRNSITASRPLVLQVAVRPFGMTNGNQAIESDDWYYSVTICKGCLVKCVDMVSSGSSVCIQGQDASIETVCM